MKQMISQITPKHMLDNKILLKLEKICWKTAEKKVSTSFMVRAAPKSWSKHLNIQIMSVIKIPLFVLNQLSSFQRNF